MTIPGCSPPTMLISGTTKIICEDDCGTAPGIAISTGDCVCTAAGCDTTACGIGIFDCSNTGTREASDGVGGVTTVFPTFPSSAPVNLPSCKPSDARATVVLSGTLILLCVLRAASLSLESDDRRRLRVQKNTTTTMRAMSKVPHIGAAISTASTAAESLEAGTIAWEVVDEVDVEADEEVLDVKENGVVVVPVLVLGVVVVVCSGGVLRYGGTVPPCGVHDVYTEEMLTEPPV